VQNVESDYRALNTFLAETDAHLKLLAENEKLRARKGGFARILDAQIIAKVTRLKNALRENDIEAVKAVADPVMLEFERNILELNFKQTKLAELKKTLAEGSYDKEKTSEKTLKSIIQKLESDVEALVYSVQEHFKLYDTFRTTFENQIKFGVNKETQDKAAAVYAQIGISNPEQQAQIPAYLPLADGQRRPTMDMIMAEFNLAPFENGDPRHLSGQSLTIRLELENAALKAQARKDLFSPKTAHLALDTIAQLVRKAGDTKYNDYLARIFDVAAKDLQNLTALTSHLSEIDRINSVSISEQVSAFEKVRANYMSSGIIRSQGFDFLTSFHRAHEYKRLGERIGLELKLRNVHATALIDKRISKEKEISVVNSELDLVRAEINLKDHNTVPTDLTNKNGTLLEQKTVLETDLTAIQTEIDAKVKEFEDNKTNETFLNARPGMREDVALLAEMQKAEERAAVLGPLSYDYSPGTGARFTRMTIIYLAAARYLIVNSAAMGAIDAFLLENFNFTIPEWEQIWSGSQFVFFQAVEASQTLMESGVPPL